MFTPRIGTGLGITERAARNTVPSPPRQISRSVPGMYVASVESSQSDVTQTPTFCR
jgi:hypothetical protein